MKLCIEIEVDDRAPNEEFCGKGCIGFNKGICHIFNTKLEDYSGNNFNDIKSGNTETQVIYEWRRCKQCIDLFYIFCKVKDNCETRAG